MVTCRLKAAQQGIRVCCRQKMPSAQHARKVNTSREFRLKRLRKNASISQCDTNDVANADILVSGEERERIKQAKRQERLYLAGVRLLQENGSVSASLLQRKLHIGYAAAAQITERMLSTGVAAPHQYKAYVIVTTHNIKGGNQ